MKRKILYIVSIIVIAVPWLFLLELLPLSYSEITTLAEVVMECIMFAALLAVVILLRKDLRRQTGEGAGKAGRVFGRILSILASLTMFLVGLVLLLIAVSFSV